MRKLLKVVKWSAFVIAMCYLGRHLYLSIFEFGKFMEIKNSTHQLTYIFSNIIYFLFFLEIFIDSKDQFTIRIIRKKETEN